MNKHTIPLLVWILEQSEPFPLKAMPETFGASARTHSLWLDALVEGKYVEVCKVAGKGKTHHYQATAKLHDDLQLALFSGPPERNDYKTVPVGTGEDGEIAYMPKGTPKTSVEDTWRATAATHNFTSLLHKVHGKECLKPPFLQNTLTEKGLKGHTDFYMEAAPFLLVAPTAILEGMAITGDNLLAMPFVHRHKNTLRLLSIFQIAKCPKCKEVKERHSFSFLSQSDKTQWACGTCTPLVSMAHEAFIACAKELNALVRNGIWQGDHDAIAKARAIIEEVYCGGRIPARYFTEEERNKRNNRQS